MRQQTGIILNGSSIKHPSRALGWTRGASLRIPSVLRACGRPTHSNIDLTVASNIARGHRPKLNLKLVQGSRNALLPSCRRPPVAAVYNKSGPLRGVFQVYIHTYIQYTVQYEPESPWGLALLLVHVLELGSRVSAIEDHMHAVVAVHSTQQHRIVSGIRAPPHQASAIARDQLCHPWCHPATAHPGVGHDRRKRRQPNVAAQLASWKAAARARVVSPARDLLDHREEGAPNIKW